MYAVVETGGKQYKVAEGDVVFVEKLEAEEGSTVTLDRVLLVKTGETTQIGTPFLQGAKVEAKVTRQGKDKKIIVYKYKAKKNYRLKKGHRQPHTKLTIEKIYA